MGFDSFHGTMFRLTLRNERMARCTELSNQTVMFETIDWLFARFQPDKLNSLLSLTGGLPVVRAPGCSRRPTPAQDVR